MDKPDSRTSVELDSRAVVTAFLRRDGQYLLVRRSGRVGTYRGRWSAVSGYLEDPTLLQQALREIREETGIDQKHLTLTAAGGPLRVPAPELGILWIVHPFLFELEAGVPIHLDWENRDWAWVQREDFEHFDTVPDLKQALEACLEQI